MNHTPLSMDHGSHDHAMTLLPGWLGITLGIVSLLVVGPHIRHIVTTAGQHRWWHVGHTVMAVGMVQMYLLGMGNDLVNTIGLTVFALITVIMVVTTVRFWVFEGKMNPLWIATAVDMAAMAYMYAPAGMRPAVVTWLFVVYLVGHAVTWATGAWGRMPVFAVESTVAHAEPVLSSSGSSGTAVASGDGTAAMVARPSLGLSGRKDRGVRVTLAVMALLMAYMLAAML